MQMTNFLQKYYPFVLIFILLLYVQKSLCQVKAIDSLRISIATDEIVLSKLKSQKETISELFKSINNKIYEIKLKNTGNLLNNIKLSQYLKESNLYADSIETINSLVNRILLSLNNKYNSVITILNGMILTEQEKFKKETVAQKKIDIFNNIQDMEKEKQKFLDKLNINTTKINIETPVEIEAGDSFESVKLKIDILYDRINYIDKERNRLSESQNELKSEILIYQDMLDFLAELRLNIDEEQDFYDRDRVNQLRYQIRDIKSELSDNEIKLKNMGVEKNKCLYKIDKFKNYLDKLLKSSNK